MNDNSLDSSEKKQQVYLKNYDDVVAECIVRDKQIRCNIIDLVYRGIIPDYLKEDENHYHLLGYDQIDRSYREFEMNKPSRIPIPENVDVLSYTPYRLEAENDRCMVFDSDNNIIDYIRLNSSEKPEWDESDYYRASHYAEDCRYLRINDITYDLLSPQDIMAIPINTRKNRRLKDQFPSSEFNNMIGFNALDESFERVNQREESKLNHYWTDEVLDSLIETVIKSGVECASEYYSSLAIDYSNENGIILSISRIRSNVRMKVNCIQEYIVEHKEFDDFFTPDWIKVRADRNYLIDNDIVQMPDDLGDKLKSFWTNNTSYDATLLTKREGVIVARQQYVDLLKQYCLEKGIEADDRYVEESVYAELSIIEEVLKEELKKKSNKISYVIKEGKKQITHLKNGDIYTEIIDDGTIDHWDNELFALLDYRTKYCFEPALIVPLAYKTVSMSLSQGEGSLSGERIVAQLIALGEDEYGQLLNDFLSEVKGYWKEGEAIPYGHQIKDWAANTREYIWVKNNFPDLAHKSKEAYTTGKRSKSKRYLAIKEAAKKIGYELNDDY